MRRRLPGLSGATLDWSNPLERSIIVASFNTDQSSRPVNPVRMITVLYFARLRETLGKSSEQFALPATVHDLQGLRAMLVARGGAWEEELAASNSVRAAVNQAMAHGDTRIADGDEVAFFPPVTGG